MKNKLMMFGLSLVMATSTITPVLASGVNVVNEYVEVEKSIDGFHIDVTQLGTQYVNGLKVVVTDPYDTINADAVKYVDAEGRVWNTRFPHRRATVFNHANVAFGTIDLDATHQFDGRSSLITNHRSSVVSGSDGLRITSRTLHGNLTNLAEYDVRYTTNNNGHGGFSMFMRADGAQF